MYPFYNDHTAYGAITSLLIPVSISLSFDKSHGRFWQWFAIISTILLSIGLYLSFSRAALIGFLGGAIVFILVLLKNTFSLDINHPGHRHWSLFLHFSNKSSIASKKTNKSLRPTL
jgi:hypothetical protein